MEQNDNGDAVLRTIGIVARGLNTVADATKILARAFERLSCILQTRYCPPPDLQHDNGH